MVQAIERAGAVDREKVREALTKGTFKAPTGDVVFDENGFPTTNGAFTAGSSWCGLRRRPPAKSLGRPQAGSDVQAGKMSFDILAQIAWEAC
jgi:hypothetical protein